MLANENKTEELNRRYSKQTGVYLQKQMSRYSDDLKIGYQRNLEINSSVFVKSKNRSVMSSATKPALASIFSFDAVVSQQEPSLQSSKDNEVFSNNDGN